MTPKVMARIEELADIVWDTLAEAWEHPHPRPDTAPEED